MSVIVAAAVAVLAASGVHLMLSRDLVKVIAGTALFSNAAILFVASPGLGATAAPVAPMPASGAVADPLAQALALTAVVISLGVTVLALCVGLAVERTHGAVDLDAILEAEVESLADVPPAEREARDARTEEPP
ncbi:MAG TPA: sodium:proton antiporter [Sandaracinaceae bacterium]